MELQRVTPSTPDLKSAPDTSWAERMAPWSLMPVPKKFRTLIFSPLTKERNKTWSGSGVMFRLIWTMADLTGSQRRSTFIPCINIGGIYVALFRFPKFSLYSNIYSQTFNSTPS